MYPIKNVIVIVIVIFKKYRESIYFLKNIERFDFLSKLENFTRHVFSSLTIQEGPKLLVDYWFDR